MASSEEDLGLVGGPSVVGAVMNTLLTSRGEMTVKEYADRTRGVSDGGTQMRDDDPRAGTIGDHGLDGSEGVDGQDAPPPKPKRGRPRCAEEPCGNISVWLPNTAQDRIIRLAQQRRQTVSEYLRDVLIQIFSHRS